MIGFVVIASVLCFTTLIAAIVLTACAVDNQEVHGGWAILALILAFFAGLVLTEAEHQVEDNNQTMDPTAQLIMQQTVSVGRAHGMSAEQR